MSSYGSGNGFYYCYPYSSMLLDPQNLNVQTLTNAGATRLVALNNVAATIPTTLNNVAAPRPLTLYNHSAPKLVTSNNVSAPRLLTLNNLSAPKRVTSNNVAALKRKDSNVCTAMDAPCIEKRKNGPCIVSLSSALPQFQPHQNVPKEEEPVQPEEEENTQPEIDIVVNNVVATFNVRCHLNLRYIALNGSNVEYKRDMQVVHMKLRKPSITAKIYSSGKVICTGATTNEDAKCAARKVARILQKLGFRIRFTDYKVVNVLCTSYMYFGINLNKFTEKHKRCTSYEPELHPGATYKFKEFKATLKLFTTGSMTIIAPSIDNVQKAVEHIFPLVYEFRTPKPRGKNY